MEEENKVNAIDVWNHRLLLALQQKMSLFLKKPIVPISLYEKKVNAMLEFVEDFEQLKQSAIIDALVLRATVLDKQIAALEFPKWYEFWKRKAFREQVIVLTTSRHTYTDAVETILSTLPVGFKVDEQAVPTPESEESEETEPPRTIDHGRNGEEVA